MGWFDAEAAADGEDHVWERLKAECRRTKVS